MYTVSPHHSMKTFLVPCNLITGPKFSLKEIPWFWGFAHGKLMMGGSHYIITRSGSWRTWCARQVEGVWSLQLPGLRWRGASTFQTGIFSEGFRWGIGGVVVCVSWGVLLGVARWSWLIRHTRQGTWSGSPTSSLQKHTVWYTVRLCPSHLHLFMSSHVTLTYHTIMGSTNELKTHAHKESKA